MACGISSRLVQVTVSPTFTLIDAGEKVKLSIDIFVSAARAAPSCHEDISTESAMRMPSLRSFSDDIAVVLQPCNGVSMMARRSSPLLKLMLATPSMLRSLLSSTFIGPGEGALPGAGCGKAVERAV